MIDFQSVEPAKLIQVLRYTAFICAGFVSCSILWLGGSTLIALNAAGNESARAKRLESEANSLQSMLDGARKGEQLELQNASRSVADLQERVAKLALESGVSLEFQASTEYQPFLTRFAKQGSSPGWSQVEVQMSLSGPSRSIVDLMNKMGQETIPIEFNTVQITRDTVTLGKSTSKAKIQLRVLVQSGGSA